jgi:hypothetical protein
MGTFLNASLRWVPFDGETEEEEEEDEEEEDDESW